MLGLILDGNNYLKTYGIQKVQINNSNSDILELNFDHYYKNKEISEDKGILDIRLVVFVDIDGMLDYTTHKKIVEQMGTLVKNGMKNIEGFNSISDINREKNTKKFLSLFPSLLSKSLELQNDYSLSHSEIHDQVYKYIIS